MASQDMDVSPLGEYDPLTDFNLIFPKNVSGFPFTKQRNTEIRQNRDLLDGALFFDMLVSEHLPEIENIVDVYPPKTTSLLRKLFESIMGADLEPLKKSCFVYYLVREYDEELAAQYARRALLPEAFVTMMRGYYLMDNLDFEAAIVPLTHPAVSVSAPEKILSTFVMHCSNLSLALAFVDAVPSAIASDESIRTYFAALQHVSPTDAFLYTRTAPLHLRAPLLRTLVEHCLTERRDINGMLLVNLPMTPEENAVFEECVKRSSDPIARDTLLLKQLNMGKLAQVVAQTSAAEFETEEKLLGMNWGELRKGVELGLGGRAATEI